MKKLYSILVTLLLAISLVACVDPKPKEVELPVLNGKNQTEIVSVLDDLELTFSFVEEVNFNIVENTFIRYGNSLSAGMRVAADTDLLIYIASHRRLLPDLSGKTELEAQIALNALGFTVSITLEETAEYDEGTFIRYGGTFYVGQELAEGSRVSLVVSAYPQEYQSPIYISKYVSSTGFNRAIEIFNSLDVEVSLEGYRLDFYLDGDESVTNTYEFVEGQKLGAGDTLLLVHPDANSQLTDNADILTDSLTFVGKDYIQLVDHKDSKIDEFGVYKVYVLNFNNRIMVRNENTHKSNPEFIQGEWDIYYHNFFSILDSHPTPFPKTFTYLLEDTLLDYSQPRGMDKVTHNYSNDGDTSYFYPNFLGDSRVRYIGINAPEMTPSPQPHAQAATNYINNLLNNATEIYVQHHPYYNPESETYGRNLGLVWADGQLVNYLMVLNGYSSNMYNDPNDNFIYEGVTLSEWFRRAEASAKANKLGIWS